MLLRPGPRRWVWRRAGRAAGADAELPAAAVAPGQAPDADVVLALVEMVATQVRAGAGPAAAWSAAIDLLAVPHAGSSPLVWWDDVARRQGHDGRAAAQAAAAAAAAWRLAERTGAPLADLLDGVAAAVRDEAALAGQVEVALAGPRATVRLLAALPLAGLLLGQLIGAHPVRVLAVTPAGRTCGVLGGLLLLAGHRWMRHLVRQVEAVA